jgi:DNA polymerase-3 subunit gamma/tau
LKVFILDNNQSNINTESEDGNNANGYRVLARRYRPKTFDNLIGQSATVRILTNAFELNRIAHAFLFTGVRGVGKTTAARIVAKGLNCLNKDNPTIAPCGKCSSCIAAENDRHVDIIEIDAASHTGVDDMRELTEGVRYKPSMGRFRIYIIDEVHMLSNQAFNALLKTLEEPPEHAKFIFCTTEIRKIPITVLSRCQKFDLRRVSVSEIINHLKMICEKEKVAIDLESLNLIARSSEGSVRDSLSLLDQAISISKKDIKAEDIKSMLGLSDKSKLWDLFDSLMEGEPLKVINNFEVLIDDGSDPLLLIEELMLICHNVMRTIAVPSLDMSQSMSEFEVTRASNSAKNLNIPSVNKCWQILLKGQSEIQSTYSIKEATEMILLRIIYAANLPDLKDLIEESNLVKKKSELIDNNKDSTSKENYKKNKVETIDNLNTFNNLLEFVKRKKELSLYTLLIDQIRVIEYKPYNLKVSFIKENYQDFLDIIKKSLLKLTNNNWIIEVVDEQNGSSSVTEQNEIEKENKKNKLKENIIVKTILDEFPKSEIIEVKSVKDN